MVDYIFHLEKTPKPKPGEIDGDLRCRFSVFAPYKENGADYLSGWLLNPTEVNAKVDALIKHLEDLRKKANSYLSGSK